MRPQMTPTIHQLYVRPRRTGGKCKTPNTGPRNFAIPKTSAGPSQKAWRMSYPSEQPYKTATPTPASSSEPAPPPHEPYDEDDITDAKGVTMHKNGWQYKVTVKCKNCAAQYKTRWGADSDPYKELAKAGWDKGRDRCGNYSWQQAHCPNFRQSCYTMQT